MTARTLSALALPAVAVSLVACGDPGGQNGNIEEVITTVTLSFAPTAGSPIIAVWHDADGDGGDAPTIDPINLVAGTSYTLTVTYENRLETPPEDITQEVRDEGQEHQLFFIGSAIDAALTHTYADMDSNGLPIGLTSTIAASTGAGELTVILRHMPPVSGQPVKTANAAITVKTSGITAIGGSTDSEATFAVTVP